MPTTVRGRIACLLVLCMLALAAGCAAKKQTGPESMPPEDMLKDISGSWRIDLDALIKEWPQAEEAVAAMGRDEFTAHYGQISFDLDAAKRLIEFHDPEAADRGPQSFTVLSRTEARYASDEEVRIKMDESGHMITLRYAGSRDRLDFFEKDVKVAQFVRRK